MRQITLESLLLDPPPLVLSKSQGLRKIYVIFNATSHPAETQKGRNASRTKSYSFLPLKTGHVCQMADGGGMQQFQQYAGPNANCILFVFLPGLKKNRQENKRPQLSEARGRCPSCFSLHFPVSWTTEFSPDWWERPRHPQLLNSHSSNSVSLFRLPGGTSTWAPVTVLNRLA